MIVTTVSPKGIVMAADSGNSIVEAGKPFMPYFDSSRSISKSFEKLYSMPNNIGISMAHEWITADGKPIHPYFDYFIKHNTFSTPKDAAQSLLEYMRSIDPNLDIKFHVAGYESPEKSEPPIACAYLVKVKDNSITLFNQPGSGGIMYCGAANYFSFFTPIITQNMGFYSLQDAVDVSVFAITMSAKLHRFMAMSDIIGGPIDVLVISPNSLEWVHRKTLQPEVCVC
jgi:hypothetical protein